MKTRLPISYYDRLTNKAYTILGTKYIKQQRWDDLTILLGSTKHSSLLLLQNAVEYLEPSVIKSILLNVKRFNENDNNSLLKSVTESSNVTLINFAIERLTDTSDINLVNANLRNSSSSDIHELKSNIVQQLIKFKAKQYIEQVKQCDVEAFSRYSTIDQLEKFISEYKIDVTEYKETSLPTLLFEKAAVIKKEMPTSPTVTDIILTNSYIADNDKVKLVKDALYNLEKWTETEPITRFIAAQIWYKEDFKILFTDKLSYYSPCNKLICIQLNLPKGFTIESVAAHEFAHYLMDKLYLNNSMPFSIDSLKFNFFTPVPFPSTNYSSPFENSHKALDWFEKAKDIIISKAIKYDNAAIKPLKLAASMLDSRSDKQDNCDTENFIKYLKDCTILPLFYLSVFDENTEKTSIPFDTANSKIQIIITLVIEKLVDQYADKIDIDKLCVDNLTSVHEYLINNCLPIVVENLHLNDDDQNFLKRVADNCYRSNDHGRAVEYIARYPEFAVLHNQEKIQNEKIMGSFSALKEFWISDILPDVDKYLSEHSLPVYIVDDSLQVMGDQI